ncbi:MULTISPECIES: DUF6124 family protein [Pseudomonas]|jgi:hypothetical protein|uniref:DUF3077 domain-containing protein n=1 Tax=Pseudomonas fluorescens NCIMB 11764 TaxID=1221522 RepID=A0A0K1QKN6_PSEFL|nr:DUF6124 family protein [Pseudomonas fluorescens]AKV06263.1 hypothetical protein B723_07600 [Pseudomonas fluorescens NCIMB 11764]
MSKPTPNPPDSDPVTPSVSTDSETRQPSKIFLIAPDIDNQTLLEYACESLASANVMASDFARYLEGSQSNTLLGIQQSIMLGELAVNRVLDNLDPP